MVHTFRLGSERRALCASCYGFVAMLLLVLFFSRGRVSNDSWMWIGAALVITTAGLTFLTLDGIFTRVVATSVGIESYNCLGRLKFALPYSELTEYRHLAADEWRLVAGEAEYKLPDIEFDDFHRVMVSHARRALRAKRWKTGQVSPQEDIDIPCLLDTRSWLVGIIATGVIAVPLWLLVKTAGVIAGVSPRLWRRLYQLKDAPGKLSLTADSITATWPWRRKSMKWSEVRAVFRVQQGSRRCFVLTSDNESIFIPPHIAADLEVMRKVFYSIPLATLCVNFDDSVRRGYRRRQRGLTKRRLEHSAVLEAQF